MDSEKLKGMKYNELQKLAKKVGIKANVKLDKLREALADHFRDANVQEVDTDPDKVESKETDNTCVEKKQKESPVQQRNIKKGKRKKGNLTVSPRAAEKTPVRTLSTPVRTLSTPVRTSSTPVLQKKSSATPNTFINVAKKSTPAPVKTSSKLTPRNSAQTFKLTPKRKSGENKQGGSTKKSTNRRSTFECVSTPELHNDQPPLQPDSRRTTFVVKETPELLVTQKPSNVEKKKSVSPGVKELEDAMKPEMTNAEMKESLMKALDKKVQSKMQSSTSASTQIPRFVSFLAKKRQEAQKPITPGNKNWNKIHQKHFDKMESIDVYIEKKRKRIDEYTASAKKAKLLFEETKAAMKKLKSYKTPNNDKTTSKKTSLFQSTEKEKVSVAVPFRPTVLSTKEINLDFSKLRKSPRTSGVVPFKPTVLNTNNMDLNFSGKTPQTAPKKANNAIIKKENSISSIARKSVGSAVSRKSINATPFKFSATLNHTINSTMSAKKAFDLKSSLARPITWKTHKGKLKPVDIQPVYTQQGSSKPSVKTYKTQTTEDRRTKMKKQRADKKFTSTMNRRGLKT